ncbi:MAG: hypothetical protein DCF25_15825 [Leptolyngbya foveolarum]|uniref:Membrane transport protein MMPL domain-containing protein n=1 Tax=Leptolyngbya foveolarum TaxID=47253 RepID=A0A2W4VN31_9CYAN|nr:MAG: hypothetical protein DCF25_15825 [Leptolyngbya foveolarum]
MFTLVSLLCAPLLENALQEVKVVDETGAANSTELLIQAAFDINPDALTVVFQPAGDTPNLNAQAKINATLASIRSLPEVASIVTPAERPEYISSNGQTQYSVINLKSTSAEAIDQIEQIIDRDKVSASQNAEPTLKIYLTGKPAIDRAVQNYQQLYADPAQIPLPKVAAAFNQLTHRATTLVIVKSKTAQQSDATRNLVRDFRSANLEDLKIQVAGQTASELDVVAAIERRFPLVLGLIMVATFFAASCSVLRSVWP